jgi:hypothetical protein
VVSRGGRSQPAQIDRHLLRRQQVDPVAAVEVVHRGDVRVVQSGQRLRFTPEPPPCRLVGEHPCWQHLEGDVAIEVLIADAVDLAHPARAKPFEDSVVREGAADHFGGRGSDTRWNLASMPEGAPWPSTVYTSHRALGMLRTGGTGAPARTNHRV